MVKSVFDNSAQDSDEPTIVGFRTARGSIYAYNSEKHTVKRLKISFGLEEQGQLNSEHLCFFVSQEGTDFLKKNFHYQDSRYRYRLGYALYNEFNKITQSYEEIPKDAQPALTIFHRDTKECLFATKLKDQEPAVGLTPIDKAYFTDPETGERKASTHMGNPIVHLYHNVEVMKHDMRSALQKLEAGHILG